MYKKPLAWIVALAMAFSFVTACGSTESSSASAASQVTQSAAESTVSQAADTTLPTEDRAGNAITVPEEVTSIATMSPSSTRTVIDLGLADEIVACDSYSQSYYGTELNSDIQIFDMMEPDQEAILALAPDIIFTTGMSYAYGDDVYQAIRESGICLADIPTPTSLEGIEEDIQFIGDCIGASAEAETITGEMQAAIDKVSDIAATIPEEDRKTVLYMMSPPSSDYPTIYTCGATSYMSEIFTVAGLTNAAADLEGDYPTLDEESAIALNPDVIITTANYDPTAVDSILALEGWENVTAIVNKDVYCLSYSDEFQQPNQHVISALIEIAQDAYPDYFNEVEDPFAQAAG